jgi:hypothetical protein
MYAKSRQHYKHFPFLRSRLLAGLWTMIEVNQNGVSKYI